MRRSGQRTARARRPVFGFENLEDRALPTIVVTTASDAVSHNGISLRDAIATANAEASNGTSESITFNAGLAGDIISLAQGQLELSGNGSGAVTIDAGSLASPITVSGGNNSRVFQVDTGAHVEIDGIIVAGGHLSGSADSGGGIYNEGTLSLRGDTIAGNNETGIDNNGRAIVTNCVLSGNAGVNGGAVLNSGVMTVSASTLADNTAQYGGGINNTGTMTVWRSTLTHNTAATFGGGIFVAGNGEDLTVGNSTFYNNFASDGGAIYCDPSRPAAGAARIATSNTPVNSLVIGFALTVNSSTLSGNSATTNDAIGGIYAGDAQFTLDNSIVSGNTPWDLDRRPDAAAYNITGTDAQLGPLTNNGGATQTMALLSGSAAIGKGGLSTLLAGGTDASSTAVTVTSAYLIALTPGSYVIQVDSEQLLVTNVSGNNLTVTRGYNGTTAAPHSANAAVYLATDQRGYTVAGVHDIGAFQTNTTNANQLYVGAVYLDVLGRPAEAGGLAYWTAQLNGGRPRGDVAYDLVHSDEYYEKMIITPAYRTYLLRDADASGLAYWDDQMKNHGLTDERLEAGFIGSPEFYKTRGGGTDAGWVDALYQAFLGRPADAQGKAHWLQQLAAGVSRSDVAYGFAASVERERTRITDDYMHYLGRQPDQQGIDYWVSRFAQGMTNEDVITGFVGSDEYYNEHSR